MDPNAASNLPSIIEEKVTKSNGDVITRTYLKGKFLGKGGFARCYEFTNQETNVLCAAKVVVKASLTKSRAKQKLMSEIKIHRSIRHQYVVQFQHFFEDSENVYILLELCSNQSLNELLRRRKRLHELEVLCYSAQIINALKYLHAHRIIHRDLKLGNLFVNEKMEVKLGDFGLASKLDFDGEKKRTICGTPNYIAPEVLEGKSGHSYEVDIWSLGVIMYTLIIGKPPFETSDVKTTYKRIRMNAYSFPDHVPISEPAKDLISKILQGDPSQRPTLDEILNHDFFRCANIPKTLPPSFLACPPSSQYLRQYMPQDGTNHYQSTQNQVVQRLESTAPATIQNQNNIASGFQTGGTQRATLQSQNIVNPSQQQTDRGGVYRRPATNGIIDKQSQPISQSRPQTTTNESKQQPQFYPPNLNSVQSNRQNAQGTQAKPQVEVKHPNVWVKKWVDYSSKYGLGYLLCNNSTGVFFNDSTKILMNSDGKNFHYFERKAINSAEKQDVMTTHLLAEYPKELQKKVTLLQHFRSYLENSTQPADAKVQSSAALDVDMQDESAKLGSSSSGTGGHVYVKKWMRTKHAIMFRLSNKIVQVNFQDHTEILLNSESRLVTYVNKKGERSTLPLNTALESNNAEMTKRLKYTKDILTHMLTSNNTNTQGLTGGTQSINLKGVTSAQPLNSAHTKRSGIDLPSDMRGASATSTVQSASTNRRPFNVLN